MRNRSDNFTTFLSDAEHRLSSDNARAMIPPLRWVLSDPQRKDAVFRLVRLYGYGAPKALQERFREGVIPGLSAVVEQARRLEKSVADLSALSIQGLRHESEPLLGVNMERLRLIHEGVSYATDKLIASKLLCENRALVYLFHGFAQSYNAPATDYQLDHDLANVFFVCGMEEPRCSYEGLSRRRIRFKRDPERRDEYECIAQRLRERGTFPPLVELVQLVVLGEYLIPESRWPLSPLAFYGLV